jgi:hypothetical protein
MNQTLSAPQTLNTRAEESPEADALEIVLADSGGKRCRSHLQTTSPDRPGAVLVGTLVEFSSTGEPIVCWPGRDENCISSARSILPNSMLSAGMEVAVALPAGDEQLPIILGILSPVTPAPGPPSLALQATVDDERIELTAEREIVLRCGKASITLTRAGKVLIRGAYLLSRSSGVNRIKGGSVQIN